MNVLYVYDGRWPRNATRVSKQIDCLLAAGHAVRLVSRAYSGAPLFERDAELTVSRMSRIGDTALGRLVNYPVFVNPFWLRHIQTNARDGSADCIVVRDLPLAPAALLVGALRGVPVHYDMAEVYPLYLRSLLHRTGLAIRVVRATHTADPIERVVVRRAATTFVVSDESRDRLVGLGVPRERVVTVGNTPANPEALRADWPVPDDIQDSVARPTAIFVGNVFADRGLRHAIDAMTIVARELPNSLLAIVGDGRELAFVKEQVVALGLDKNVRFLGWKDHRDHAAYLRHCQVGILPFLATEHTCITLANKLFDYMGAGLPVIASDVPPMRRVLLTTGSGLLAPPGDHHAIARLLLQLFRDRGLRETLGANGRAAVAGPYAWRKDARRFVDAIERGH